jgi:hypothetical protein
MSKFRNESGGITSSLKEIKKIERIYYGHLFRKKLDNYMKWTNF